MDPFIHDNYYLEDGLELERVAVGPYCVFDNFNPLLVSPKSVAQPPFEPLGKSSKMEGPLLSNEYPFGTGVGGPWLNSPSENMSLAAPPDDFGRGDWNEWMQWDPAAAQQHEAKLPFNAQGPVCFKSGQKAPLYNRRQDSQHSDGSIGVPSADVPTSSPFQDRVNNNAFSFGESIEHPPSFHFDMGAMTSPSTHDGSQHNGHYSPTAWDRQQTSENAVFPPTALHRSDTTSTQMPPESTPSLHHSPSSLNNGRTSSSSAQSSPEPALPANPRKRKSSSDDDDKALVGKKDKQPPIKKTAHNMIEKRYRTNLNDKIAALRDSVPSLRIMSRANGNEEDDDPEDLEGLTPAHKLNKATVLSKATEYIRHLEKRNKRLTDELSTLKGRMDNYEKMAITGPMMAPAVGTPDGSRYHDDSFVPNGMMPPAVSMPPQGMIPVPESMANLHRGLPPQPHYAPQYPQYTNAPPRPGMQGPPLVNGRRNNALMGKLMVGSLAGLMVLEGLVEREQPAEEPAGRGLFALPLNLANFLMPRASIGGITAQFPLVKLLLVFGAFFYLIAPLLDLSSKPKKKSHPAPTLVPAPSLASPVEVRQKAWLTAIQTVWVPQHNFLLEVAALALKTLKLSTRKVIGWQGYAFLTSITKEQEAGRVKAWNIALDAQLAGGDAEISMSRLVLTLMASGTLPDTPARLMLKALHIRVLLWEVAKAGYGTWYMFEELSAKLARRYWNEARSKQRIASNVANSNSNDEEAEPLPDYLAALLDMECDDVLVDSVIQRAYNLAWNKPSAEHTIADEAMDSVVEDFAISSPLDALAAWWSSFALNKALVSYLGSKDPSMKTIVQQNLDLAACTAPPTSQAQLRAMVAQAVIDNHDRSKHIATALKSLPPPSTSSGDSDVNGCSLAVFMNVVGDTPIAIDVQNALTLAKCLDLVDLTLPEARRRATSVLNNTVFSETNTTLLSFIAGYNVLNRFVSDSTLQAESSHGLERLASSLRMWVGHEAGRRSGLSNKVRGRIVVHCLDASKTLVGLSQPEESDAGYHSQSDTSD